MNNKKINIRYQITHYQPIYTGAGKSLEKLIKEIDKEQFKVEVLTAYKKGLPRKEYKDGYTIIRVGQGFFGRDGWLSMLGKIDFSIASAFFNLIHRNYHILKFIGVGNVALLSIIIAKVLRKPIVNKITAVGDDDPKKMSTNILGRLLIKLLGNNASHWVISEEIKSICLEYTNWKNLYLITNPVEIKFKNFHELSLERTKRTSNNIRFLFVGALNKRKGVHILLDLWENYNLPYELYICGPKVNDEDINSKIDKLKNPHIKIIGNVDKQRLEEFYLQTNYFLFPSNREGLPNVVLESMSYGTPVIAYNIPGVIDFLLGKNNERGIMLEAFELNKWKEVIDKVISLKQDNEIRSVAAYEWVRENSSYDAVVTKWQSIYKNIVYGKN